MDKAEDTYGDLNINAKSLLLLLLLIGCLDSIGSVAIETAPYRLSLIHI